MKCRFTQIAISALDWLPRRNLFLFLLEAGHRLGLVVLSRDNEATLRPTPGTGLTLDPAGTSVTVPLASS
ncbi:hypothetical protein CFB41_28810 [Burkholderia sp. AU33803]|nr:hypothetical protein CFB41_28810 [Burkholderia sp. AU33803]PRD92514.1 hypothetical protein C6P88_15550 [Burkholderia contaminans]